MEQTCIKETAFDEVFDSQRTYRKLIKCMSRPGQLSQLDPIEYLASPENMNPYVLSIIKTLCDHRVTFANSRLISFSIQNYLKLNSGVRYDDIQKADFALFQGDLFDDYFPRLKMGDIEFPEDSATAIIMVDHLSARPIEKSERSYRLTGPGIKDEIPLHVSGLNDSYVDCFQEMNVTYPLGIDVIFIDHKGFVACWPRTVKVEVI
jgi:alpha-D-ribose 1-methylphosphonate 5-triphosphate synthase subunit PhnH